MVGDPSSPGLNTDFYYTLFTSDDAFDLSCQTPTNVYEGVQLHFGPGDGLFVTNVDLTTTPELFWQLPVDAQGAYLSLLSQDADGLQAAYGQPAWWCTGEDELPPEPRAGTNNAAQGVDNASPPGCIPGGNLLLEYPCECNDFTNFGLPSCSNLTASVGFGVVDTAKCPGECDADGSLSIDDFQVLAVHWVLVGLLAMRGCDFLSSPASLGFRVLAPHSTSRASSGSALRNSFSAKSTNFPPTPTALAAWPRTCPWSMVRANPRTTTYPPGLPLV